MHGPAGWGGGGWVGLFSNPASRVLPFHNSRTHCTGSAATITYAVHYSGANLYKVGLFPCFPPLPSFPPRELKKEPALS